MTLVPLHLDDGTGLAVDTAAGARQLYIDVATGRRGIQVEVAGQDVTPWVQHGWRIERRTGVASTATATLRVPVGRLSRLPQERDEVIYREGAAGGVISLFGGYLDEPAVRLWPGESLYEIELRAIGWRSRLDDRVLTQAEGVRIYGLATAAAQIAAVVDLLADEGFTSVVELGAPDSPLREDMRFVQAGAVLDRLAQLNDAVVVVDADKRVTVRSRSFVTAPHALTAADIALIEHDVSTQNYRTAQIVRGGALTRIEQHAGRADGRYRLGGEHNLQPEQSLLDAPIGDGVQWSDTRSRGGAGRGHDSEAVLVQATDTVSLLPASAVTGPRRRINKLSLEAYPRQFTELDVDEADGPVIFRQGGVEGAAGGHTQYWTYRLDDVTEWRGVRLWYVYIIGTGTINLSFSSLAGQTLDQFRAAMAAATPPILYVYLQHRSSRQTWGGLATVTPNTGIVRTTVTDDITAHMRANPGTAYDVILSTSTIRTASSVGMRLEGVDLTDDSLSNLGMVARVGDGTEYAFRLSALTGAGGDDSDPYFWPLAALPFSTSSEVRDAIAKLRAGESTLVIVDTTAPRVDFDNRTLLATDEIVEIDVTSLENVDVDGADVDIGGSGADWEWVGPAQELVQSPAASPPPTAVNVQYKAHWVRRETSGAAPHVDRVQVNEQLATPDDGSQYARDTLTLHGLPADTVTVELHPAAGHVVGEGDGCTIPRTVLDRLATLRGAAPSDVWRTDRVDITGRGRAVVYTLRLLRRSDESRYRDDWRRAFDRTER